MSVARTNLTLRLLLVPLVGWLGVGSALTVLAAWSFAWHRDTLGWGLYKSDFHAAPWPFPPPAGWPAAANEVQHVSEVAADCEFVIAPVDHRPLIPGGSPRLSGWMIVFSRGLPLRSMAYAQSGQAGPGNFKQLERRWALSWGPAGTRDERVLPLRPLWPGFALDSLFYAALAWGLWQVPMYFRRRHRVKRDHCSRCGYSLAGLSDGAPCPECGAAAAK